MSTALDVACFGELLWDFYEVDQKSEKGLYRRELGGTSANVAVTLARLGIKTGVVGGIGEDKLGTALDAELSKEGVDTSNLVKVKVPTGITFVTTTATGEATFSPYRSGTADGELNAEDMTTAMGKAKFVVFSTSSMIGGMRAVTEKLIDVVEKTKGTVVVDLNVRAHQWADPDAMRTAVKDLVAKAQLIKASERDLNAVAGKRGMSWLDENAKHANWILTRGENGAAAIGEHGQATAPTKRVRCIDRSGGGDAFMAGALAVLVKTGARPGTPEWKDAKMWTRALEVGHLLGAKAVGAQGAIAGLSNLDDVRPRLVAAAGKK